jgi:hypothetical protein
MFLSMENIMKKLILAFLFLQSFSAFAYTSTDFLCSESKQTSAFIKIMIHEATNEQEKTFAIKTEYTFDGAVISEVKMEGEDPDFNIIKATTDDGEKLVIVSQMIDDENGFQHNQYICSK